MTGMTDTTHVVHLEPWYPMNSNKFLLHLHDHEFIPEFSGHVMSWNVTYELMTVNSYTNSAQTSPYSHFQMLDYEAFSLSMQKWSILFSKFAWEERPSAVTEQWCLLQIGRASKESDTEGKQSYKESDGCHVVNLAGPLYCIQHCLKIHTKIPCWAGECTGLWGK